MSQLYDISVAAGNDLVLSIPLSDENIPTSGHEVQWFVFACDFGVPILSPILIGKSTEGSTISWAGSPNSTLAITLSAGDTTDMLGNYYHEAMLMDDASDNRTTLVQGTFTVTQAVLG